MSPEELEAFEARMHVAIADAARRALDDAQNLHEAAWARAQTSETAPRKGAPEGARPRLLAALETGRISGTLSAGEVRLALREGLPASDPEPLLEAPGPCVFQLEEAPPSPPRLDRFLRAAGRASYHAILGAPREASPAELDHALAERRRALASVGGHALAEALSCVEEARRALSDPRVAAAYARQAPDDDPDTVAALALPRSHRTSQLPARGRGP